jgi:hypothetical protein
MYLRCLLDYQGNKTVKAPTSKARLRRIAKPMINGRAGLPPVRRGGLREAIGVKLKSGGQKISGK